MGKNYWIVKQEPTSYSWDNFVQEGKTAWTGVRNFAARNHLRGMQKGDAVFFYHSGDDKEVVGLARVTRAPYPDPTATEGEWVAVELSPVRPLRKHVGLPAMKSDPTLREMPLIRQSRLSVAPLTAEQFKRLLELAETRA